jgi:protein-S-isoprenylcysteine O-methyltransferase Ste14
MTNSSLPWLAGGIFVFFSAFSLWFLRRDYRLNKKLSWLGSAVHVVVYAIHGMFSSLLVWGTETVPPIGPLAWLGIPLMIIGLAITFYAMDFFRTFSRWVGNATPGLATSGLYRYSRNPQFVGYGLFVFGFLVVWWNALAWIALLSYAALAYGITLVEEEHLTKTYGDSYRSYCQRVPRYLGIPQE